MSSWRLGLTAMTVWACHGRDAIPPPASSPAPTHSGSSAIYVLPSAPELPDGETVLPSGQPTTGFLTSADLANVLPPTLAGAPLVASSNGRYSAAATYQLANGQRASLSLDNTFHRASQSEAIEDINEKSPRVCPKHDTLQGAVACIGTRLASGSAAETTVLRWYLPDRIVVHLDAPTEALARQLATGVPIDQIAKLSAAP